MKQRVGLGVSFDFGVRKLKILKKDVHFYWVTGLCDTRYIIEIVDVFGERVNIDSLRHSFTTYEAAKSYSQFYTNLYGKQYKFRVVGRNRIADPFIKKINTLSNER